MNRYSHLRNPSRRNRILIISGLAGIFGVLAGAIVSLFFGGVAIWLFAGGLVGATLGAIMEAGPLSNSKEELGRPSMERREQGRLVRVPGGNFVGD